MAQRLLIPHPENATIEELKQVSRVGSNETATRCTAIQMLLAGADRELVCNSLLVTNRALRKWINRFNKSGVNGLIDKKRPGRMAIVNHEQADQLAQLIDQPEQAQRSFWTAKAFHGYISKARWFNNHVCKNEEKLLERLDQAILDVIDNLEMTQQTTAIGTLF